MSNTIKVTKCVLDSGWVIIKNENKDFRWRPVDEVDVINEQATYEQLKELGINAHDDRLYIIHFCKEKQNKREEEERKDKKKFKVKEATSVFVDYLEMADEFIELQPIFYTPQKIWWLWNFEKLCWEMVDEIDLLNKMSESMEGLQLFRTQIKNEILNSLKMRGRIHTPKEADKTWIQFKNKIYDLKTNKIFKASPKYFITNPTPYEIGESEETPVIDKFFEEWVGKEYVRSLYEIIAYSMLPDYPLHRVFCLNGEGRNGKGSFLKLLTNFIGKDNLCSTDFDTLVTRPFEAAKLYKKLVCIMGEINSSIFKRTSLFKKLTGADLIGFEFKGKDGFDEYNYAKLIVATNKIPESTDKTIGFYSRWAIIDFPNRFAEKTDLLDIIPEQEYKNLGKKAIRILQELLKEGKFSKEGAIEERMARYEERASPIREFLKNCCEKDIGYETPFWELYEEYEAYLDERGFRKASKRELSHLLKARGFETKRAHFTKKDGSDGTMVVVIGIGLNHMKDELEAERMKKEEAGGLRY